MNLSWKETAEYERRLPRLATEAVIVLMSSSCPDLFADGPRTIPRLKAVRCAHPSCDDELLLPWNQDFSFAECRSKTFVGNLERRELTWGEFPTSLRIVTRVKSNGIVIARPG